MSLVFALHFHDELLAVLVGAVYVVDDAPVSLEAGHQLFVEEAYVLDVLLAGEQTVEEVYEQVLVYLLSEDALETYVCEWVDEF